MSLSDVLRMRPSACVRACVRACLRACVRGCVCVCVYVCVCVCVCVCVLCVSCVVCRVSRHVCSMVFAVMDCSGPKSSIWRDQGHEPEVHVFSNVSLSLYTA